MLPQIHLSSQFLTYKFLSSFLRMAPLCTFVLSSHGLVSYSIDEVFSNSNHFLNIFRIKISGFPAKDWNPIRFHNFNLNDKFYKAAAVRHLKTTLRQSYVVYSQNSEAKNA